MNARRLIPVACACGIFLWSLFGQLNHYLSSWNVSLFVGGLLVTFPALRFSHRDGWKIVVLLGLWCDATAPVRVGLHAVLFLTAYTFVFQLRDRFPREEAVFGVFIALIANAGIFIALTVALLMRNPHPFAAIPAVLIDLLVSELFVAMVGAWFFALQEKSLEIAGLSLRREQRGLL